MSLVIVDDGHERVAGATWVVVLDDEAVVGITI